MGFAVLETVATFSGRDGAVTHGFDGEWSYQGKTVTWCGKSPTGNLSLTRHERSTVLEVTCKACLATVGDVVTVMVLEPCCDLGAPWSNYPENCPHVRDNQRVPTFTEHTDLQSVRREWAKTRGWGSTDGYLFNGRMPAEGERFRIMPVGGSLTSVEGFTHTEPWAIDFPTVEAARAYADAWHEYTDGNRRRYSSLVNIVGDRDTVVRWSSYGVRVGTVLEPHATA